MSFVPLPTDGANNVKGAEQRPLNTTFIAETLAEVTNGTDGTYYYYVDMDTFRKTGWQLVLDGGSGSVTATVEGTIQNDGTAMSSCAYEDVTSDLFGAASFTADALLVDNAEALAVCKYVRIKIVASTGGSNDADWTIYHARLY
jgi:hypothetical protein